MTKRQDNARHRAATSTGSLEILSNAVASNAGQMGRQAAVIAAAGGLVVTLGVSGAANAQPQAAPAPADNNTASLDIQRASATKIVSAKVDAKSFKKALPVVKVVAAPAEESTSVSTAAGQATLVAEVTTPAVETAADTTADSSSASSSTTSTDSSASSSSSSSSESASTGSSSSTSTDASAGTPVKKKSSAKKSAAQSVTTTKTVTKKSTTKKAASSDAASSVSGSGLAATAKSYLGAPYVLGGNTPSGWDCSGFVRWVYKQNGKSISARTARGIWGGGQFVKTSNPKPGDIIIQRGGAHIAIYMGGGKYIGAQNPSSGTAWRDLSTTYDSFNGYYTWAG